MNLYFSSFIICVRCLRLIPYGFGIAKDNSSMILIVGFTHDCCNNVIMPDISSFFIVIKDLYSSIK